MTVIKRTEDMKDSGSRYLIKKGHFCCKSNKLHKQIHSPNQRVVIYTSYLKHNNHLRNLSPFGHASRMPVCDAVTTTAVYHIRTMRGDQQKSHHS